MGQILRLSQKQIRNMIYESVKKIIREKMEEDNQDILQMVRSMRSNVIDLTDEDYGILYVDYDPSTNELYAGTETNGGIIKDYSVQYDRDLSLDVNLQDLVDEIYSNPPTEY